MVRRWAPAACQPPVLANATICNSTDLSALPPAQDESPDAGLGGINAALLGPTLTMAMLSFAGAVGPIVAITLGSNMMAKPAAMIPPAALPSPAATPHELVVVTETPLSAAGAATATTSGEGGGASKPDEAPQTDADLLSLNSEPVVRVPVLAAVCAVRLVLCPIFGIALVWAGCRAGIIAPDPVLCLVLLVESAMPSAINLQLLTDIISDDRGAASRAMARVLATQYLSSVLTITFWISVFLLLINGGAFAGPQ